MPLKPPPFEPDPILTRASVAFHTNDEDKDSDTVVSVNVLLSDGRTVVATIEDHFGHFGDHSDAGPFTLLMVRPVSRELLRTGRVEIQLPSLNLHAGPGGDTWRFNFLLDLLFADGGHLFARANGIELVLFSNPSASFGIE